MNKAIKNNYVSCNLCGSAENKVLFGAKDRLHGLDGCFTYVKCTACGLVYMNPQIAPEDMSAFYPPDYAPHESNSDKEKQSIKAIKSRLVRDGLPKSVLQRLNKNSRVLDVGCGSGKFLNRLKSVSGCKVIGLDISEHAAQTAKQNYGLDIFTGLITDAPFPPESFDMITAWQYLEHVHNPSQVLQKFHDLLKPNGICILSTPNFDSFNAKIFKNRWFGLDCPRHLYLYSPRTIDKLLKKTGFNLTRINYDKSSKNLLGSLQYFFYGDNYNASHRNKIKNFPLIKTVFSPMTRISALLRKADNMIIFARKKT